MKIQNRSRVFLFRGRMVAAISLALMAVAVARADYQSTVLGDNPLAYYALNPAADGTSTAPDLTGNGNDGLAANISAATGPTAYLTNAANFNGSAAIDLSQGSNAGLLNFNGPIALEAWVQPSSSSLFGDIVAKGYDSSTYQEIVLRVNGPYGANYYCNSGSVGVSGGAQTTAWTYVVMSSDGVNCSLYVNGVLVQQSADVSGSVTFGDDWMIGNGSSAGNGRLFNGNISEVAIYGHGLTAEQVLAHYYVGEINAYPSNSAPLIAVQPQPQATYIGGAVTFSVGSVSAFASTNQWLKNGNPISGQTGATLTLNNVQAGDVASYSVKVGNQNGLTTSASAALTLFTPANLKWSGSGNSGVWDNASSANWVNVSNGLQTVFHPGDNVLFDDTAGTPTSVSISGTVVPSVFLVNASVNNYSIGSGTISGSGSLVKQGSSTLTLTSPGGFAGPVAISGGAVYAGNNCFSAVAGITITNNATLDLGGGNLSGNKPVTVSGVGLNGEGAIYNSYNDYPGESLNVTLAGDTKFGGSARWDLASGSQISGAHNLALDWSAGAGYGQWNSVTVGSTVAGIMVTNGSNLGMVGMDASCQNPGTLFTFATNCQLIFYGGGFNGSIHLLNGSQAYLWAAPAALNGSSLVLEDGAQWASWGSSSTAEPINSAVTLNGVAHFIIGDHNLVYTNTVSGAGGFVEDYWNSAVVFSASNTYSGPTIIGSSGNSPEVALVGNGSISHSALIFFGGNSPTTTHLDVSGRSDQTLTLASGQTLAGIGGINGSLVVGTGATVSPAGTNTTIGITTGANPVGTLAASGSVTLNGTTVLKLNGSGSSDMVQAGGNLVYGGTLNLANISGSALAAGNSFQVFSAANYSGSFAAITPAVPGAGLAWDASQLSSGIINVVSASLPVMNRVVLTGGSLIFGGTNGLALGSYTVLTTTNLGAPLTSWIPLTTNTYDAGGNFSVTNPVSPGSPQRFYRIKQ